MFVAAASPYLNSKTLQVGIAAFDAGSGALLWQQAQKREKATIAELRTGVSAVTAEKDFVTYSIGKERWTVRAADGVPLPRPLPLVETEHAYRIQDNGVATEVDPRTGKVVDIMEALRASLTLATAANSEPASAPPAEAVQPPITKDPGSTQTQPQLTLVSAPPRKKSKRAA